MEVVNMVDNMKMYNVLAVTSELKKIKLQLDRKELISTIAINFPKELQDIGDLQFGAVQYYKDKVELRFFFQPLLNELNNTNLFTKLDNIEKEGKIYRVKDRKEYLAFHFHKFDEDVIIFIKKVCQIISDELNKTFGQTYHHLDYQLDELASVFELDIFQSKYKDKQSDHIIIHLKENNDIFKKYHESYKQWKAAILNDLPIHTNKVLTQKNITKKDNYFDFLKSKNFRRIYYYLFICLFMLHITKKKD